ncbi:hypothetical protein D9M68_742130 [compost metagenome]
MGNWTAAQMSVSANISQRLETRLARKPTAIALRLNRKKKLLPMKPNAIGDSPKSAIAGLATSPRTALSPKFNTMKSISITVTPHALRRVAAAESIASTATLLSAKVFIASNLWLSSRDDVHACRAVLR